MPTIQSRPTEDLAEQLHNERLIRTLMEEHLVFLAQRVADIRQSIFDSINKGYLSVHDTETIEILVFDLTTVEEDLDGLTSDA